ncbi:MAG: hypothetical protein KGS61_16675, partial [Verrucomicrobia bacterium]|nr:hypothetical protein [Verrucomicrobiota bacterium]
MAHQQTPLPQNPSGLNYNPASRIEDLFHGVQAGSVSDAPATQSVATSQPTPKQAAQATPTQAVQPVVRSSLQSSTPGGAIDRLANRTPDRAGSVIQQLTTSLKTANGPPGGKSSTPQILPSSPSSNLPTALGLALSSSLPQGSSSAPSGNPNGLRTQGAQASQTFSADTMLTGTTVFNIGGTTAGDGTQSGQYDAITMTAGQLTLGGTLQINLSNGFVPSVGQTFNIIQLQNGSTATGTFAAVSGLSFSSGGTTRYLVPVQGPNGIRLVTSALPSWSIIWHSTSATGADNLAAFFASGAGSVSLGGELDMAGFASVSGSFSLQVSGSQLEAVASGVNASVAAGSFSVGLTNGSFALEIHGSGTVALEAAGGLAVSGGNFANVTVNSATLEFNDTGAAVNQTLSIGATQAPLVATNGAVGLSVSGLSATFGGFVSLSGNFAFQEQGTSVEAAGSNLSASVAAGGTSVGLTAGTFGFIYNGATNTEAFEAQGGLAVTGGKLLNAAAQTVAVEFNNSGINYSGQTVGADGVNYTFGSGLTGAGIAGLVVQGFSADVAGFVSLSGNFSFAETSQGFAATASAVGAELKAGSVSVGVSGGSLGLEWNLDGTLAFIASGAPALSLGSSLAGISANSA